MMVRKRKGGRLCLLIGLLAAVPLSAQGPLPGPFHDSGQGVTASFEGWFHNADGSFSVLFGYYNRNQKQELDIPIGPDNRIEPGGPDRGQPTHFLTGRQWGMFTVTVPQNFGKDKVTWTLTANGQTAAIPASLDPLWEVEPFKDASENTPPTIRFSDGQSVQGPRPVTASMTATVSTPITLTVTVSDDAKLVPGMQKPKTPPATVTWSKFRGPGAVRFANARPPVQPQGASTESGLFTGTATTTATFSEPGDYMLSVVGNDWTGKGGRGFQCCWTNALVKISVKP